MEDVEHIFALGSVFADSRRGVRPEQASWQDFEEAGWHTRQSLL